MRIYRIISALLVTGSQSTGNIPVNIQFLGYDPLSSSANAFRERLVNARRALGLSQQKMAERLGVDETTLQGWESGRHQPTGKSLDVFAKVLWGR